MNTVDSFLSIVDERQAHIDAAPAAELKVSDPVRDKAAYLHPQIQQLKVMSIREYKDARSYVLEPDNAKGSYKIAPFSAGQYLSLFLKIGSSLLTRPYSISSGPLESLRSNAYTITVKRTRGGFASDYILDNWKTGTEVAASAPEGTFSYEMVRDARCVIAIAGGSGITPFRSMASAIADGFDDYNLIILYGNRTREDILFKEDFDDLQQRTDKVKVVHVLSEEASEGFEHGFISSGLISRYIPSGQPCSFFICGPEAMYRYIRDELKDFKLPRKYIRFEMSPFSGKPDSHPAYPLSSSECCHSLIVRQAGNEVRLSARGDEPVLIALERAGLRAPSRCRSGECGFCRSKLVSGEVFIPEEKDGRRLADMKFGYIHPCCTFALSDLVIEIPS